MDEIKPTSPVTSAELFTEFHLPRTPDADSHLPKTHPAEMESYGKAEVKPVRIPALTVDQVMSSPLVSLTCETDLKSASELMDSKRFRHIPIKNKEGVMVGIISDRDLLRSQESKSEQVSKVMSKSVRTVPSGTSIRAAASILLNERIGALIVLDFENLPLGIVTNTDILRAIVEKAPIELWV